MRVIVVGAGEVGASIAESLSDSHEVTVVDVDAELVESLQYSLDVLAVNGDGSNIETLREVGVATADILIATTDDDETNIVMCGVAKTISDTFTIARVKRPHYLKAWRSQQGALGVDFMVCTDLLTAKNIVGVIGLPTAQDVDTFADGLVQITEFEIPQNSPVAGKTVEEADRFDSLTFASILREDEIIIPQGRTRIEAGDDIVVIGSPDSTRQFSAAIAPQHDGARDVVIVGGSEVGYQTARLLENRGFSPRLIERDTERARWLAEHLPNTTVLENDATDQEFLDRENVGQADAVVAALENEQQNLLATLLAKRLGTDRAVAVVNTGEFVDLFEAVGVDVAVSPRESVAEEITRFTRTRRAENVSIIEGDRAEVLELEVNGDSRVAGRTIRDSSADFPSGVVIGAITRDDELITPRGDTEIRRGDHVVVFADKNALEAVTTLI